MLRAMAVVAGLLHGAALAQDRVPATQARPFIVVMEDDPASAYLRRWGELVYTEIFRRLEIPVRFERYPLARREAMVEAGAADCEASRVRAYGDGRPYLVRVEESLVDLEFSLFGANPALRLEDVDDPRLASLLVEYRRGIHICETALKARVAPGRVSDVLSVRQGLEKLLAGRTDAYCDIDSYVQDALRSREFKTDGRVRRIVTVGRMSIYPYLHRKHAALAPRLAAVLRQVKSEGLAETYWLQAARETGTADGRGPP